ncbi:SNF2 family N-terminal domain-containing protein [Schizophyllum commune]
MLYRFARAEFSAEMNLVALPPSAVNDDELPFQLQLTLSVSLTPGETQPAKFCRRPTKLQLSLLDDAQTRMMTYVFPSTGTVDIPPVYPDIVVPSGAIDIPFFYSTLRPAPSSSQDPSFTQPKDLKAKLLPFQRRSVNFLLGHEGLGFSKSGKLVQQPVSRFSFWDKVSSGGREFWFNRLSSTISLEEPEENEPALGAILAEEPGLGKTVEMIALILLTKPLDIQRNPTQTRWDPEAKVDVRTVKTTLIVTPPTLASQWCEELAKHAPSLKVLFYDGWNTVPVPIFHTQSEHERVRKLVGKAKRAKDKAVTTKATTKTTKAKKGSKTPAPPTEDEFPLDFPTWVNSYDVVITTYRVLAADLAVALPTRERPRRQDVVYANVERPRSPLVICEWNRVVMDEVQMVGGGKTEDMVSLIPRRASYAVSGTPARQQVSDLIHVIRFLRVDDVVGSSKLWNRLIQPAYAAHFAAFIQSYAVRTTKASVKDELTIPQQTRYVVPVEMGRVERHVYDETLEGILYTLGLDARGVAASAGWELDTAVLRAGIRRLRAVCTHPQVGQLQRQQGEKTVKAPLKTMEQVLESMRDQNWKSTMDDRKSKVLLLVRQAQLVQQQGGDPKRERKSLALLETALQAAGALQSHLVAALDEHREKGEELRQDYAEAHPEEAEAEAGPSTSKGKGRAGSPTSEVSEDVDEVGIPKNPEGDAYKNKLRSLKARLRECRIVLHKVHFLLGDIHHVLNNSDAETEAYAKADELRSTLLKSTEAEAQKAIELFKTNEEVSEISDDDPPFIDSPYLPDPGEAMKSRELMREANSVVAKVLNAQTELLWTWRGRIKELLTKNFRAQDDADGGEYQRSLDDQGEIETYLQAYVQLLADKREAMTNERTLLAAHDARERQFRQTKAAREAAAAAAENEPEAPRRRYIDYVDGPGSDIEEVDNTDVIDLQPEHEVLQKTLLEERKELVKDMGERSIKSIMNDIQAKGAKARPKSLEKTACRDAVQALKSLIKDQNELARVLEVDLRHMRRAFNQRVMYFRQLQEISDSVASVEWEGMLDDAVAATESELQKLEGRINTNVARQRYLENLGKAGEKDDEDEEEDVCILCRCEFVRGFITPCAHIYCEGCMKMWTARPEGKTCPVCRVPINPKSLQRFTVNEKKGPAPPQPSKDGQVAPQTRRKIDYNTIDPELYKDIQAIECEGDYGHKIQTLIRHLLYIQLEEEGAKSIVFSAWADSLFILQNAMKENDIPCLRIDQADAANKFRTDPNIQVLLLHGERENAGLNVTCASRVFLLESVVHHGFEIQAIARIDRMGQQRPTEVFCYYAEDTVEKNILDLAAKKGLSLYTTDNAVGTVNVSFAGNDEASGSPKKKKTTKASAKQQKGDYIMKTDDMLEILFPHMYEDLEYLLPEDAMQDVEHHGEGSGGSGHHTNAVAGPSRVRA